MKSDLLNILACPQCQGSLIYLNDQDLLICKVEALSFPIRDDIPLLINHFATKISNEQGTAKKTFSDKAVKLFEKETLPQTSEAVAPPLLSNQFCKAVVFPAPSHSTVIS